MASPRSTRPAALPDAQAEQLAAVEEMIATLRELRQRARDRAVLGAYQAALDRLDALAYRLAEAGSTPIPLPTTPEPQASAPAPSPSQAALPLGPVIVVARKPRRR
jgi:hypothetical protein